MASNENSPRDARVAAPTLHSITLTYTFGPDGIYTPDNGIHLTTLTVTLTPYGTVDFVRVFAYSDDLTACLTDDEYAALCDSVGPLPTIYPARS